MIDLISDERLKQMSSLLLAMSQGRKMPVDGLGIYLGDGLPRPESLGRLRSLELKAAIDQLIYFREQQTKL